MNKKILGIVAGVAASASAAAAVAASGAPDDAAADAHDSLAVLRAAAGPSDALPLSIRSGSLSPEISSPEDARFLGSFDGSDWFVAPGKEPGRVCILQDDKANESSGGVCSTTESIATTGLALGSRSPSGGVSVALLRPDGYTDLTASGAEKQGQGRNVAFAVVDGAAKLTLSGQNETPFSLSVDG